ncbi:MAG: porin [Herminiimonas sp.]|nr:porin [Herminiimonas sp.]
MKKSLVALAVLSAFAGIASAQTSVTVYGVVDAGITREDNGVSKFNRLDSGNQSGSRLGFKGNEDLGGGLSAQFLLEQGFNVDSGSLGQNGLIFGRQAYVGLSGNFGQLRLGRQKTVMYDAIYTIDPFGIANKGGMDRLFATNTAELVNTPTALRGVGRANNTIAYFTPNLSGFTGQVTYSLGEQANNNQYGRQYGLSLNYAAGPLFVTLDYLNVNSVPVASLTAPIADSTAKTTLLGATYDFGVAKAHAAFGLDKGSVNVSPTAVRADQRDYMVGATIPFGASAVQVDYIRKLDRAGTGAGAKQYALGYTYALSKRTNFYSSFSATNQDNANYVSNGVANQIDRLLNVGVRHTF